MGLGSFAKSSAPFVTSARRPGLPRRIGLALRIGPALLLGGLALLVSLPLLVSGCRSQVAPPPAAAAKPPAERTIVSLVPSVTETIFALGLGQRDLGRCRYCTWPPEALKLPVLGDALKFDHERLLALHPDIVIFNTGRPEFYDRLTSAGIRTLAPRMETVDEVYAVIDLLGRELGAEGQAAELAGQLRAELRQVRDLAATAPAGAPPKVLITIPLMVGGGTTVRAIGRKTFVDELLVMAGGVNAAPSDGYPNASIEVVVGWAPDLIIISAPGDVDPDKSDQEYRRAWSSWPMIPAVKSGRLVVIREPYLTLPGPRMGQAARLLLKVVHPELAAQLPIMPSAASATEGAAK